jgi:hypothetical protein
LGFESAVLGSDSGAAEHLAGVIAREAGLLARRQACVGAAEPEQPSVVPVDIDRPLAITIMADDPPSVGQLPRSQRTGPAMAIAGSGGRSSTR